MKNGKTQIDVFELCREGKITLVPYSADEAKYLAGLVGVGDWVDRTDGFAVQVAGKSVIFWNDRLPMANQRSTIAYLLLRIFTGTVDVAPPFQSEKLSKEEFIGHIIELLEKSYYEVEMKKNIKRVIEKIKKPLVIAGILACTGVAAVALGKKVKKRRK